MGKLNMCIKGSTVIEVIVASIIFLVIFTLSMDTLVRISSKSNTSIELIDAQSKVTDMYRLAIDNLEKGQIEREYSWGRVVATIAQYKDYNDLKQITITATIKKSKQQLKRYYIVEYEN